MKKIIAMSIYKAFKDFRGLKVLISYVSYVKRKHFIEYCERYKQSYTLLESEGIHIFYRNFTKQLIKSVGRRTCYSKQDCI